jgi:tripartite-type tricarboxylate transporter receptor subunit TctC
MQKLIFNPRRLLAGLCLAWGAMAATAQDFPARPLTLVSPYQAGSGSDAMARVLADAVAKELGQPVVVEAKPGAEGLVGSQDVKNAPPDGYRLLWGGAGSLMINAALHKKPPFDPAAAFTPIAGIVEYSFFLYVNPELPAKDMKEFIAYVKANPGKLSYAVGSNQSRLTMLDLAKKYGLDMVEVKYRGEPAATVDLLSNRIQATFATAAQIPNVREGKLRILATTLPRRSPLLPDVPTVVEAGTPVAEFGGGWLAIYGPAGVPKPVVERLNQAFNKAFQDPNVQNQMNISGLVYSPYPSPQDFAKFTRDQRDLYVKTIKELGVPQEE